MIDELWRMSAVEAVARLRNREISPLEQDLAADDPPRPRDEPHDAQGGHRLAASRLPDDAQGLAGMELERDSVNGLYHPFSRCELRPQVADLEQWA